MPTMEDVATSVSALAGLLSAIAGLVTAFRRDRTSDPAEPRPASGRPAGSARPARPLVGGNWTAAGYGALALLMAFALVLLVGVSGAPPDREPLIWLRLAVGIPFALAAYFGVSDMYAALKHREPDLLISSGTGLTAAASALAAMLIAGTYQSTGPY